MTTYYSNDFSDNVMYQGLPQVPVLIDQNQYHTTDYVSQYSQEAPENYQGYQTNVQQENCVAFSTEIPQEMIMVAQPMMMPGELNYFQNESTMPCYINQSEQVITYQSLTNQPILYQPEASIIAQPVYEHGYYQLEVTPCIPVLLVPQEMSAHTTESSALFSPQTELIEYHFHQQGVSVENQLIHQDVSHIYDPIQAVYPELVSEDVKPAESQPLPSSLSPISSPEHISPEPSTSSDDSKKDEDEKENLQKAKNFKTRMCIYKDRCNQGPRCTYAHSTAELRSNEIRKASNQLKKTKLCMNFARGGSGKCEYGENCQFIHPEDGLLYKRVFRETLDFVKEKADHKNDIQFLHAKKSQPGCTDVLKIEEEINEKIREWNQKHPKAQDYYDLHWMTTRGAEDYVEEILEKMKGDNKKTSWIETGRGRHSWNGVAAIKTTLIQKYTGRKDVSLTPDSKNAGLLILTIL
ncbi:unnamed protein product [Caenorhabditis nigoni]